MNRVAKNSEAAGFRFDQSAWFRTWFNSTFYHQLYQHRNESEAADFIDALLGEFRSHPKANMLDLGCGAGRHSKYLASKGFNVTGLDLAFASIRKAKGFESDNLRFYRHDMRVPFGQHQYSYVYSFFTSFGYFDSQKENDSVIKNISNALTPGGLVMIDFLNVSYAEEHMVLSEEKNIDGIMYHIKRWTDPTHFYKEIVIDEANGSDPVAYTERIEKICLHDFMNLFGRHGLVTQNVYGDYSLGEYDVQKSPRLIVVARKNKLY